MKYYFVWYHFLEIILHTVKKQLIASKKYYYSAKIDLISGGNYGYSFRVMPKHEMLLESANLDLIKWVEK